MIGLILLAAGYVSCLFLIIVEPNQGNWAMLIALVACTVAWFQTTWRAALYNVIALTATLVAALLWWT